MSEQVPGGIRVLVVDDHELFRQGVGAILDRADEIDVVGEADNGQRAIDKCGALSPDVVLMDINMPVCDGLTATHHIHEHFPNIKILILTVSDTEEMLFEAVKAGASGYVLKTASPVVVIDCVKRVHAGEPVIPGNLAMQIISEFSKPAPKEQKNSIHDLTEREIDVLRQLSTGASNREIASTLYISENTVRNHVRNILEKLHVSNRVQAAAYAVREGFIVEQQNKEE